MKLFKEETECITVSEEEFAKKLNLETVYCKNKGIKLCSISVNRPGMILTGYEKLFAGSRVQVMGKAEIQYLNSLEASTRKEIVQNFFSKKFPCLVVARGQKIPSEIISSAKKYKIPLFRTIKVTAVFINDVFIYLNELLAPSTTMHGILLDVFGIGVLITGRSGIGKSEAALELVHRGHRLVSDDIVEIKDINGKLFGYSPPVTEHLMEIRGLGLINVKSMYGVGAVLNSIAIELVIELRDWSAEETYNRIGEKESYEEILGLTLNKKIIPIIAGRNIAVLMEVAVSDHRLKQGGYNTLDDLNKRMS